jgi:hypothetical protein
VKRFLLLFAACGGGGAPARDVCDNWVARDPGADRHACEQLVDAGVPDPAAATAPTFAAIACASRSKDAAAYARCRDAAVAELAALVPALDAPDRIVAAMDHAANDADNACGQIADAMGTGVADLPDFVGSPRISAMIAAGGALCHRDVMIHESRTKTCIDAAMALGDIRDPYRTAPETKQAWADLIARCPDQKGIITEAEQTSAK